MKKFKIIFTILFTIIILTSCEKEYPKDTPEWLQIKIDELIEESGNSSISCSSDCRTIDEYSFNNNIIYVDYLWVKPDGYYYYQIYNYSGTNECNITAMDQDSWCDTCGTITNLKNYNYVRTIWQENH